MKRLNRLAALRKIATEGGTMRIALAKSLGLTKMSSTNVINDLLQSGYVTEGSTTGDHKVGRNPIPLTIADTAPKSIGIWISRDHVSLAVCDLTLKTLFTRELPLRDETEESIREKLVTLTAEALPYAQPALGIGIAMIGPIDAGTGELVNPKGFFHLRRLNVRAPLVSSFALPVLVNNDMNCAALAESMYGIYRNYQDLLYVGLDNGVGSGIISGGRLLQKGHVGVGEIGHMTIDYNGIRCACGNTGCLENYVSIPVLEKQFAQKNACFREHCALPENDAVMRQAARRLTEALISLVNILHPDIILMGHQASYIPVALLEAMEEQVNLLRFSNTDPPLRIRRAYFGEAAPMLGGAALVHQAFFQGESCSVSLP